jgi:nucleotide-binding universal stress UspA family protein
MKRILIATDFSTHAERALHHAAAMARRFGAEVELLTSVYVAPVAAGPHVAAFPEDFTAYLREQAAERIERLAAGLRRDGLEVRGTVSLEAAAPAILSRAEEWEADLVAVGTRGLTGIAHVLLGSVAERVARLAPCPVLTAHAETPEPGEIRTILVPTDFSEHAEAALEWARRLAVKTGARIVLVHAYYLPPGVETTALAADELIEKDVVDAANRELEAIARSVQDAPVDVIVARGRPCEAVVRVSREVGADLLAIGSRGRSGLAHVMFGSTAERILRMAAAPVVSLKRRS